MSGSVLEKFAKRPMPGEASAPEEGEAVDDLMAFGWLRGVRDRAIMLELRHKDGNITAHPYAWLKKAKFDPSDGIILDFSGERVRIVGRNLNAEVRPNVRLFAGILRQRVPWIQEADGPTAHQASSSTTVIEELKVMV